MIFIMSIEFTQDEKNTSVKDQTSKAYKKFKEYRDNEWVEFEKSIEKSASTFLKQQNVKKLTKEFYNEIFEQGVPGILKRKYDPTTSVIQAKTVGEAIAAVKQNIETAHKAYHEQKWENKWKQRLKCDELITDIREILQESLHPDWEIQPSDLNYYAWCGEYFETQNEANDITLETHKKKLQILKSNLLDAKLKFNVEPSEEKNRLGLLIEQRLEAEMKTGWKQRIAYTKIPFPYNWQQKKQIENLRKGKKPRKTFDPTKDCTNWNESDNKKH